MFPSILLESHAHLRGGFGASGTCCRRVWARRGSRWTPRVTRRARIDPRVTSARRRSSVGRVRKTARCVNLARYLRRSHRNSSTRCFAGAPATRRRESRSQGVGFMVVAVAGFTFRVCWVYVFQVYISRWFTSGLHFLQCLETLSIDYKIVYLRTILLVY